MLFFFSSGFWSSFLERSSESRSRFCASARSALLSLDGGRAVAARRLRSAAAAAALLASSPSAVRSSA